MDENKKVRFGTHIGNQNIQKSINEVEKYNGNVIQIFYSNKYSKKELNLIKNYSKKRDVRVIIHSSYKHNIARKWTRFSLWIIDIIKEIEFADNIGSEGIVLHFGKKLNLTEKDAFDNMFTSLIYINIKTQKHKHVKIFLETSSGQGTELCYKLRSLAKFYNKILESKDEQFANRIKLCLDTCHIFAAGYNIKTENACKIFLKEFDRLIGLKYIRIIHLNDSKEERGSNIDRHENIDNGYIGYVGLKFIFDYFDDKIIILETPNEGYKSEIKMIINDN